MSHVKIYLFVIVFQVTSFVFAKGNDHGNGGGVICINNKCQTLADSGLVISPEYKDFWVPESAVIQRINELTARYPLRSDVIEKIRKNIYLNFTHFKFVEIVDQAKLDQIKKTYLDTLKNSFSGFDSNTFKIVAISNDNTSNLQSTILLPDFFNLNIEEQAKILIHEGFYRGRPSSDLGNVLSFEVALKKFENINLTNHDLFNDMVAAQITAYNLGLLNHVQSFVHILESRFNYINDSGVYKNFSYKGLSKLAADLLTEDCKNFVCRLVINKNFVYLNATIDIRVAAMLLNVIISKSEKISSIECMNLDLIIDQDANKCSGYKININQPLVLPGNRSIDVTHAFEDDISPPFMNYDLQKEMLSKIDPWIQQETNGQFKKIYSGKSEDNLPCSLKLTNFKFDPLYPTAGAYYISLGTSKNHSNIQDDFTWIGAFITHREQNRFNDLQASADKILVNHTQSETLGGDEVLIKNEVIIYFDSLGRPSSAVGRSSKWPSTVCNFN